VPLQHTLFFSFYSTCAFWEFKSLVCPPSGMRPTDLLCLACEFRVAINEHSGMTTGRKFQYLHWYGLLSLPMTLMCNSSFARAQRREVCDLLIYCVWHVNFGWLWTNNPTWLQDVSSNIRNFFDLLSLLISCLWCATLLCRCSGIRNVTNLCLLACDLDFMDCFHRNRS